MNDLRNKHCQPCEGGVEPLDGKHVQEHMMKLDAAWKVSSDGKQLRREYRFKNFYHTMSFVNAVAHIANREDHHPDLSVGYNYCHLVYTTHAIGGLSENDFICAAKVDALLSD